MALIKHLAYSIFLLFLPECHASVGGAVLPEAARVEGDDVVQEVRQGGDLASLVPRQHAKVVVPEIEFCRVIKS